MNEKDVAAMLTWISQVDGRIEVNKPTAETWHHALGTFTSAEVKAAVLEHYRTNENQGFTPAASPGGIRKLALNVRELHAARTRAITAAPATPDLTERDIRQRAIDRPDFKAAFERGRIEGNSERAYWTNLRDTGNQTAATQAAQAIRSAAK